MTAYMRGFISKLAETVGTAPKTLEYRPTAFDVDPTPETLRADKSLRPPVTESRLKRQASPPFGSFNFGLGRDMFRATPEVSMGRYPGLPDLPGMDPIQKQDSETFKGFQGNFALNIGAANKG